MAHKTVVTAVRNRLTGFSVPVIEMNTVADVPDAATNFIQVQYPVSNTERPSVTTRYYWETGVVRFVIQTQRDIGTDGALDIAESVSALFRDQKLGGVDFKAPDSPFLDDSNDAGPYFTVTVVCPYTYGYSA